MQPNQPPTNTSAGSTPKFVDQVIQKSDPSHLPKLDKADQKPTVPKPRYQGVGIVVTITIIVMIILIGLAYYAYKKSTT